MASFPHVIVTLPNTSELNELLEIDWVLNTQLGGKAHHHGPIIGVASQGRAETVHVSASRRDFMILAITVPIVPICGLRRAKISRIIRKDGSHDMCQDQRQYYRQQHDLH